MPFKKLSNYQIHPLNTMDGLRGINIKDSQPSDTETGKYYLFGIGINEYQSFPRLNNARKDIEDIKDLLSEHYTFELSDAILLYDADATRENIIEELSAFRHKLESNDRLLILYSGHGYMDGERGFWIPVDAKSKGTSSFVSNVEVREIINTLKAKHILLISDSCFSGSLLVRDVSSHIGHAFTYWNDNPSRYIFISGKGVVADGKPGKNSPFAAGIIKHLKQSYDQKINIVRLADEVTKEVRFNYEQQAELSPLFQSGHEGGQFLFIKRINQATPLPLKQLLSFEKLFEQKFTPFTWTDDPPQNYIPPPQFMEILQAVLVTKTPLIISGETGTGITIIPEYFSKSLQLDSPYYFSIKKDTSISDILYRFDSNSYDSAATNHYKDKDTVFLTDKIKRHFIKFGPLGTIIRNNIQSVIVFCDIDLAPDELCMQIIEMLKTVEFEIPETGEKYSLSQSNLPIVIFTTKNSDDLADDFLGHCLLMDHPFPGTNNILDICKSHISSTINEPYLQCLVDCFIEMRSILKRTPSLFEFIQWLKIISAMNLDSEKMHAGEIKQKIRISLSALLKNKEDVGLISTHF